MFGVWPTGLDHVLDDYADTMPGGVGYHLALWHGVNLPLLLSILVLAAGTAAFLGRARLRRARLGYVPLGNADRIYDAVIRGADVLSRGGSPRSPSAGRIPATQSVILSTLVLLPVAMLLLGARDRRSCDCGTPRCRWWSA